MISNNNAKIKTNIVNFIIQEFLYDKPEIKMNDNLNLIEQGILDSMEIFRLVQFIETEAKISFEPEEMVQTNLRSVNDILQFIEKKQTNQ